MKYKIYNIMMYGTDEEKLKNINVLLHMECVLQ